MGFSTSAAAAVVFLGALLCASTLYPVYDASTERFAAAEDANEERALDRQNTDLTVVDATYTPETNESAASLRVTVVNEGTTTLSVDGTSLLVDGEYVRAVSTTVDGDGARTTWAGGERLVVTLDTAPLDGRPDRIVVVAENGVTDATEEV
jgi:flagellar protein FlaF